MSVRSCYLVYGLRLASNRPIEGLVPLREDAEVDYTVDFRIGALLGENRRHSWSLLHSRSLSDGLTRGVWLSVDAYASRVEYGDGTGFLIDRRSREIVARWDPASTFEDTLTYFLGPILGLVLRHDGTTCLHGSAIAGAQGGAFAIVGPSGAGKSTTAAALALRGERILSDDVVAVYSRAGVFEVPPGYTRLRLWPTSGRALFKDNVELPRLSPNWEKRYLDLEVGGRFADTARPLAAVYILDDRLDDEASDSIEAVAGRDALLALIGNTYPESTMLDTTMRAAELRSLAEIAMAIPVRRVRRLRDPAAIPALCDMIVSDFARVTEGTSVDGAGRTA